MGAAGAAIGALAIVGDGAIFEANRPRVVSIEVSLSRLTDAWDGFRIAQLSDLHYDDYFSVVPLRRAIDILNRLQPDLVVITGDFATSLGSPRPGIAAQSARVIEPCAKLLAQIHVPAGILAALGNHDVDTDPDYIIEVLQAGNIPVLRNRAIPLERYGKRLWFAGLDDILHGKPRLDLALKGIPSEEPIVLLVHEPDWADQVASHPVDLQLSGHSHGGQIRIPLLGAPYLPPMARKYPWGLRQIGRLALYTNAGIGTIGVPVRLDAPPEITLITLRKALRS